VHQRVAVFIDGDFWHGFRYQAWRVSLTAFWRAKIESNRARDQMNQRRLRRMGWRVVRIWQHQIETDIDSCVRRITKTLQRANSH
jgi:DNA mismatch endonuclease (patch repair protein)